MAIFWHQKKLSWVCKSAKVLSIIRCSQYSINWRPHDGSTSAIGSHVSNRSSRECKAYVECSKYPVPTTRDFRSCSMDRFSTSPYSIISNMIVCKLKVYFRASFLYIFSSVILPVGKFQSGLYVSINAGRGSQEIKSYHSGRAPSISRWF